MFLHSPSNWGLCNFYLSRRRMFNIYFKPPLFLIKRNYTAPNLNFIQERYKTIVYVTSSNCNLSTYKTYSFNIVLLNRSYMVQISFVYIFGINGLHLGAKTMCCQDFKYYSILCIQSNFCIVWRTESWHEILMAIFSFTLVWCLICIQTGIFYRCYYLAIIGLNSYNKL